MSELMDDAVINMPYEMAMADDMSRWQYYNRAKLLLADLTELQERLRAAEADRDYQRDLAITCAEQCIKSGNEYLALQSVNNQLRARIEAAEKQGYAFKNFHRLLCERFNYSHDEIDWQRDQVSLIEHISLQKAVLDWEKEAKRAFWTGLEIGAGMGNVSILPRWDEYIKKRKVELSITDRCPSHESDQLSTLKAHGLAEGE